jgi:hypothetical protein
LDFSHFDDLEEYKQWSQKEMYSQYAEYLPLKQAISTDPFRVVLFDDIKGLLFQIKTNQTRGELLDCFLRFLKFPIMGIDSNNRILNDPYVFDAFQSEQTIQSFFQKSTVTNMPFQVYAQTFSNLYGNKTWLSQLSEYTVAQICHAGENQDALIEYII